MLSRVNHVNNTVFGYSTSPIGTEQVAINGGQAHLEDQKLVKCEFSVIESLRHIKTEQAAFKCVKTFFAPSSWCELQNHLKPDYMRSIFIFCH